MLACAACGGGDGAGGSGAAQPGTVGSDGAGRMVSDARGPDPAEMQAVAAASVPDPLEWRLCGSLECAELKVPLDPSDPQGQQISIALNRQAADPSRPKLGVLLFNPGGPGEPGKPFLATIAPGLAGLPFDLIGFDPRGVGDSDRVDCAQQADPAAVYAAQGAGAAIDAVRAEGEVCRDAVGPLFQHVGTNAVVGDIEQIRLALRVEQINFYGLSYGTRLGAVYAQRYPDRIRALVLDSPMPPKADLPAFVAAQFEAVLAAHQALISGCEQGTLPCPADAAHIFDLLVRAADDAQDRAAFLSGWALRLSNPLGRGELVQILAALEGVSYEDTDMLATMEDMMDEPQPPGVLGPDFSPATNQTVNCADSIVEPPNETQAQALMESYAQRSELFAPLGIAAISCAGWPVQRDPVSPISFSLRTPPLIIAGVADTLTPLPLAEDLHAAIAGSSLLVSQHYGHGALLFAGPCVGEAISRYLLGLVLPADGTTCPSR
jgi:pimeloyl-ACP methyl ester carboxylesterase